MEKQPSMEDVADQFEQLLIRIMLSVLYRLKNEVIDLNTEEEIEF